MSLFEEPSVVGTHHAGMEGATQAKMLCVHCGSTIEPNATSMCLQCLSSRIDITEGISTQLTVHRCRGCERWLKPNWITADLESPELLGLCIKKVNVPSFMIVYVGLWSAEVALALKGYISDSIGRA